MKTLMCGIALSLGMLATNVIAEQTLTINGEDYTLSALMENCQRITGDPAAQISCFTAISSLMDEQANAPQEIDVSITETLDALRAVAQYRDDDSGLLINGSDCNIHVVYYNNYFHISRRCGFQNYRTAISLIPGQPFQ